MRVVALFAKIVEETDMWQSMYHGTNHWMNVRTNAMYLAERTGGDVGSLNTLQSFMTVCGTTKIRPKHGQRALDMLESIETSLIWMTNSSSFYKKRVRVIRLQGLKVRRTDPTLAACWDGDRLDIEGKTPDPKYLFSDLAKQLATLGRIQAYGTSYH